jgi:hypothetical protein
VSAVHEFPKDRESLRPFRLWDTKNKRQMQWRYYAHKHNAHIGALIEARWAEVGTTIEVFDVRYGRLVGQYTRKLHTVAFTD